MQAHLIFWPVLLTLMVPVWVLLLNGKRKKEQRKTGDVDPRAAIDNTAWGLPVVLTSNALANQFQLPVIFYVLCFILYSLNTVSIAVLVLCWLFAISRWAHAYVHVTSNYIPYRMIGYLFGGVVLLALFGLTIWSLAMI